jgi:adenosylcobinamide hydrolase
MKYFLRNATLFIRGTFRAASTGPQGGIGDVPTLLLCSVKEQGKITDEQVMENRASGEGLSRAYFGLVSETGLQNLAILQYDYITVFILRGTPAQSAKTEDSIHIIIYSGQGFSDAALLGAMITGTEAKTEALSKAGFGCSGSSGDRMVVASEGSVTHTSADSHTEAGKKIRECVRFGISRAPGETRPGDRPALYVFSRFGEEHFAEWTPEHCPYYPCHFEGQCCDYCYCPFYPCGDEGLGQYVTGTNGRKVWNCSRCELLHKREIAEYLRRNPEASLKELKKLNESR